jgi:hypothetical protein
MAIDIDHVTSHFSGSMHGVTKEASSNRSGCWSLGSETRRSDVVHVPLAFPEEPLPNVALALLEALAFDDSREPSGPGSQLCWH